MSLERNDFKNWTWWVHINPQLEVINDYLKSLFGSFEVWDLTVGLL